MQEHSVALPSEPRTRQLTLAKQLGQIWPIPRPVVFASTSEQLSKSILIFGMAWHSGLVANQDLVQSGLVTQVKFSLNRSSAQSGLLHMRSFAVGVVPAVQSGTLIPQSPAIEMAEIGFVQSKSSGVMTSQSPLR
jgi:hypothetical protein